jgi:cobalt/nickel transport system permease protein
MRAFAEYSTPSGGGGNGAVSAMDARVKIAVALALLAMSLSCRGFAFPCLMFLLCMYLCRTMKIPLKVLMLRFSEPVFIATVLIALKFFFSGSETMFTFELFGVSLTGHSDGLMEGLAIGGRIMGGVSIVAALGFSTPFTELMAGLAWYRIPSVFIEICLLAYRYIFVLIEDAEVIYNAQKNRLGYTSIRRGLGSFGTLAGALTLRAFENSQNITTAMTQRGYDGSMPQASHKPLKYSDVLSSIIFLVVMGVIWRV